MGLRTPTPARRSDRQTSRHGEALFVGNVAGALHRAQHSDGEVGYEPDVARAEEQVVAAYRQQVLVGSYHHVVFVAGPGEAQGIEAVRRPAAGLRRQQADWVEGCGAWAGTAGVVVEPPPIPVS